MEYQALIVVGLIALAIIGIVLALYLIGFALDGAIRLFAMAAHQGFVGLAAYVAAWVFLLPFMLVASIVIGFLAWLLDRNAQGEARRRRIARNTPPSDPDERYKWANRLPPYDK